MKHTSTFTKKEKEVGSNTDSRSKRNGQSHEISHECDLDDWDRTCRVTCSICRKEFKSNSTFLAHVSSPRHRWKQDQMAMTSQINLQSDSTAADEEDVMSMKDEGLAWTNDDPMKATFLLSKAGKGLIQLHNVEKARECFQKALAIAERLLKDRTQDVDFYLQDDVFEDEMEKEESTTDKRLKNNNIFMTNKLRGTDLNIENNNAIMDDKNRTADSNGTNTGSIENEDDFRDRSQTRPRIKRFKMEQMNRMYSVYKLQRGTADLYETMIQCYAESFDIDLSGGTEQDENGPRQSLKLSEILMNRDLVLKELADTEKTYVDSLGFLVKTVIPAFKNAESPIIDDIFQGIFANIDEIFEWHNSIFLDKIEDCLEDPDLLGATFKDHEQEITSLYEVYCQNKPKADDLLLLYANEIDQVFQTIETSFTILDYLIKPVQRVMKYQLLLQSILKYTKKMGENTASIQTALEVMEVVPKKVNDKMHLAMIIGYTKSLERDQLVLQDTLDISFGGGRTKARKYRLFLFNDFLLFTEPIERVGQLPRYKFCLELKTCRMGVTQTVENDRLKFAIWSRKFKTTDIYVCTADTQEIKVSWLSALTNVFNMNGSIYSNDSTSQETDLPTKDIFRTKTWSVEQIARQATIGHPREYSMSSKLKANIQKFLMEELSLNMQEANFDEDFDNSNGFEEENGKTYLTENKMKKRSNQMGRYGNSFNELTRTDSDKILFQGGPEGSLQSLEEDDESKKSTKGFRIWRSLKADKQGKRRTSGKSENYQRLSLPDQLSKATTAEFALREDALIENEISRPVVLSVEEIFELQSIAAELKFLLVQSAASLSWENAEQLLEESLELFCDLRNLKEVCEREKNQKNFISMCEGHYERVRQKGNFKENTKECREKFYSYHGLFDLLMMYADLSAGNTMSSWPIFLYSMAIAAAKLENKWKDAFDGYNKLSQIYKARKKFEQSVDCLIEAYQITLSMNDVKSAATCLKDALETAMIAGNEVKCQILEAMATKLFEKSKEMGIDTPSLKLVTEMSVAFKRQDYSWFNRNYHRICECEGYLENQDKSRFRELLTHLLEHLKEKKQTISGEVFV